MVNEAYNIVGEVASMFFGLMVIVLMLYSRPRITFVYKLCSIGLFLAIIDNAINLLIIDMAVDYKSEEYIILGILMIVFLIIYFFIVALLFAYISFLSAKRRMSSKPINIIVSIFAIVYFVGVIELFLKNNLMLLDDGVVELYWFERFLLFASALTALMSVVITFIDYKNLSKFVRRSVLFYFVMDYVILYMQDIFYPHIFISITYVIPFVIFYVVFHANPYDELMGTQDKNSLETIIRQDELSNKESYVMFIQVPRLNNIDYLTDRNPVYLHVAKCTRKLESLGRGVSVFNLGYGEFAVRFDNRYSKDIDKLTKKVESILDSFSNYDDSNTVYRLVTIKLRKVAFDPFRARMLFLYILDHRVEDEFSSMNYMVDDKDIEDFEKQEQILRVLKDIFDQRDLNDERVICFAQPIYDVKTGSFRTAEALMRLKFGDQILSPDKFIYLAERHGYVHTLTCVMLNKVCKMVKKLETEGYDFDGVTINCSALEFSSKNMDKQLFKIIYDNKIDVSHIRIELTESAIFTNSKNVANNMKRLNEAGIIFYLDDFGTGYSNFERVRDYPFNIIKFDKSLLYAAVADGNMSDVMHTMINMFKAGGCKTLVEGVENDYQNHFSIDNGFDFIQGYKYAVPGPIEGLEEYFKKK